MTEPPKSLTEQINNDVTLASCKKTLIILSSILLALTFSGAKVTEANTFIFKITFSNPTGFTSLLLLVIGYLLIRYNSISSEYVTNFNLQWPRKVLNSPFYKGYDSTDNLSYGFVANLLEPDIYINEPKYKDVNNPCNLRYDLKTELFYNAYIELTETDKHSHRISNKKKYYLRTSKNKLDYKKAVSIMFYYWLIEQFRNREFLELYSPMFIGFIAVFCSVWSKFNTSI